MMGDVRRLGDRVSKLGTHFKQAQKDIDLIDTSTAGVLRHGEKISQIELEAPDLTAGHEALGNSAVD